MDESRLQMKVTIERHRNPGSSKTQPTCIHGHDLDFEMIADVLSILSLFVKHVLWKLYHAIECICSDYYAFALLH